MHGLIRTEGDRLAILTLESNGGTATAASRQQLLAPEVTGLHFRYFDGAMWYPYWVSGQAIAAAPTTNTNPSGSSATGSSSSGSSGSTSSSTGGSSSSGSSSGSTTTTTTTAATTPTSTTSMGRVPRAIEVTITLASPQFHQGSFLRVGINKSTNVFRTVILVPISDPLPAQFVP